MVQVIVTFSILTISWSKIYITIEYVFLASNIMSSIYVLFCIFVHNISGAICWLFLASQLLQSLVHNISIILASLYSAKTWTKEKQKQQLNLSSPWEPGTMKKSAKQFLLNNTFVCTISKNEYNLVKLSNTTWRIFSANGDPPLPL